MAGDSTPWFIGIEGVEHSAEVARSLAYAATGGHNGVVSGDDFQVIPYSTPGGGVRILPGIGSLVNNYVPNSQQSYIARKGSVSYLTIDPTTSSGPRSDLVIATVRDPQLAAYADWNNGIKNSYEYFRFSVIKGVGTETYRTFNNTYPGIALARIDIPASTGTITSAMIKDMRLMTSALTDQQVDIIQPTGNELNMAVSEYQNYPRYVTVGLDVPVWCRRIIVETHYSGIESTGGSGGDVAAGFRGVLGNVTDSQNTVMKTRQAQRINHTHTSEFKNIPAEYRGRQIAYATMARQVSGTGALQLDYQTTITYRTHYMEVSK